MFTPLIIVVTKLYILGLIVKAAFWDIYFVNSVEVLISIIAPDHTNMLIC